MGYFTVWGVVLLGLLVPVMSAAPAPSQALDTCPAWTAGGAHCACPCACRPVSEASSGHGLWGEGLAGPSLLARWLALGRLAVPLGIGGLLLGLGGLGARAAGRRRSRRAPAAGLPRRRWARAYATCCGCGETTRPHHAHGLCRRCYARQRSRTPVSPEGVEESMS
jgi:hypothetical protein